MLALQTGWTPTTLASLPAWFRSACHWALFVKTLLPDGIPAVNISPGMSPKQKQDAQRLRVQVANLRPLIFPEDPE